MNVTLFQLFTLRLEGRHGASAAREDPVLNLRIEWLKVGLATHMYVIGTESLVMETEK
jgi:hypothetical protein